LTAISSFLLNRKVRSISVFQFKHSSATSAAPTVSPRPWIHATASPGTPASCSRATKRRATTGVCSAGFAATALPVQDASEETYLAYDPKDPEKAGITAAEVAKYKLPAPRPVIYANGIFMTAGQHKGMMLLTLLKKSTRDIKAIIYVDDNVRHVGNVFSAAVARNIEAEVFHYQREDTRVQRFQYSDKHEVDDAWAVVKGGEKKVVAAKPQSVEVTPVRRVRRRLCRCW